MDRRHPPYYLNQINLSRIIDCWTRINRVKNHLNPYQWHCICSSRNKMISTKMPKNTILMSHIWI